MTGTIVPNPTTYLLLTVEDADLGIRVGADARKRAREVANETGQTVSLRHPTTDKVVAVVKPKRERKPCCKQ
jgi:DNA-binding IclR family transcriptional regulator